VRWTLLVSPPRVIINHPPSSLDGFSQFGVSGGTDAQYLVNQLQIYYLADNKYQLVKTFNHDPARFDYNSLINDLKGAGSEK